jgi:hypothetical protein
MEKKESNEVENKKKKKTENILKKENLNGFMAKNKNIIIITASIVLIISIIFVLTSKGKKNEVTVAELNYLMSQDKQEVTKYKDPYEESKEEIRDWKEYKNDKYNYSFKYPNEWTVFTFDQFQPLEELEGMELKEGGYLYISNYDNQDEIQNIFNQFSDLGEDENNNIEIPEDFRYIGFTIFEKEATYIEDFANILNFSHEKKDIGFKANNLIGQEYVGEGLTASNPKHAIIFQKDNKFYVFQFIFSNKDKEDLKKFEQMVSTFNLE